MLLTRLYARIGKSGHSAWPGKSEKKTLFAGRIGDSDRPKTGISDVRSCRILGFCILQRHWQIFFRDTMPKFFKKKANRKKIFWEIPAP